MRMRKLIHTLFLFALAANVNGQSDNRNYNKAMTPSGKKIFKEKVKTQIIL